MNDQFIVAETSREWEFYFVVIELGQKGNIQSIDENLILYCWYFFSVSSWNKAWRFLQPNQIFSQATYILCIYIYYCCNQICHFQIIIKILRYPPLIILFFYNKVRSSTTFCHTLFFISIIIILRSISIELKVIRPIIPPFPFYAIQLKGLKLVSQRLKF